MTLNQCKQMIVASLFATCGMLAVPAIARTRPSQPIWINFINSTGSLLHHFPATFMGTSNGTDFFATHQAGAFSSSRHAAANLSFLALLALPMGSGLA